MLQRFRLACIPLLLATLPAAASGLPDRSDLAWSEHYVLHADQTYSLVYEDDWVLNTARAVALFSRSSVTYWPDSQTFAVREASVTQPDGARMEVPAADIFTRPSAAAQSAPGYVNSLTTSIEFPQLVPGSRLHVKWQLDQTRPPPEGFSVMRWPNPTVPHAHSRLDFIAPASLPLRVAARGFVVTTTAQQGLRHITADMADMAPISAERGSVAPQDFAPIVVATTQPDLPAYGAMLHRQAAGRDVVSPAIAALAAAIRGPRTGLDAARAISDWVAGHIRYVAVYLNPTDGWVAHPAAEVLDRGFGDCKDHVVLMQALLAASNIRAEPAIVQWGNSYQTQALPVIDAFNHAMVYLPDYGVFTNPTSPYTAFGQLDSGLSGKTVVIASAEGAVARTPDSRAEDNRYVRRSAMQLQSDGSVTGESRISFTGELAAAARQVLANEQSLPAFVENTLALTPEGGEGTLRTSDPRDLETPLALQADWRSPRAVPVQEGDMFLTVPVGFDMEQASALRRRVAASPIRHTPMVFGAGDYLWTAELTVPEQRDVKRLPPERTIVNALGSFTAHYRRVPGGLAAERHLTLVKTVVPAEAYGALQDLIYAAAEDARGVVVLAPRSTTTGQL